VNGRLAACAVLLLAAGCASLPEAGGAGDWPARRQALQQLADWDLKGRVAVAAGGDGFSGGLRWRQAGARSDIELRGPLGGTAFQVTVDGAQFIVTDDSGATLCGDDARRFVLEQMGGEAPLPIAEMRYWLLGAPAPGAPHRESLGPDQRLAALEQSGWHVAYASYRGVGELALPSRLEIAAAGLRLRVAVSDWRLGP
jgi:outer membrane lipoprotein LolB